MSTAALNRPQSQPRAEAELPNPRGSGGTSSTAGPHVGPAPNQDPGVNHPHLLTRPVFYIHAPPPPPPFMHYQWPMPFYSPFTPFSGMGYSMLMPPIPPAPYMEPSAYFVPHNPMQDYRRMVQPHPNSVPYPGPTRRPRPPHTSLVRETVNSEVQTDPRDGDFQTGSPLRSCADSGRGTAPSSPTSTTSCNQKNVYGTEESSIQTKGIAQLSACPRDGAKSGLQMNNPQDKLVNSQSLKSRNLHLVRQENVETVNTPAKDVSNKERRVSVPDILMSWNNGQPQEEATTEDKRENLLLYKDEVANVQSSTVVNKELLDAEKDENNQMPDTNSCEEPCENSLNISPKVHNVGLYSVNEPTLEEPSDCAQTQNKRKKLNESIWSVESLPGFVPTKEWLAQNTTMGAEVIVETVEEMENGSPCDEVIPKNGRNSSNNSLLMSESFIDFSTPASKVTMEHGSNASGEPVAYKLQKFMNPLASPIYVKGKPTEKVQNFETKEVPAPESSPKKKSFTVEENLNVELNEGKTVVLEVEKGCGEELSQKKVPEAEVERLLVPLPLHAVTEVSPSKVDCGVQFPELQPNQGNTGMNRKHFHKSADCLSTRSEGYYGNGLKKRNFHSRNKDRPYSQQEMFHPYMEGQRKPRGGKGRY